MNPGVGAQFGVEGGADDAVLSDRDRPAVPLGEHLDRRPDRLDNRCADEHRRKGLVEATHREWGLETVALATECVSLDGHIEQVECLDAVVTRVLAEQDESGTGREHRPSGGDVGTYLRGDTLAVDEPRDGRRLTTRDQEQVTVGHDTRCAYLADLDRLSVALAGPPNRAPVLADVALHREDACCYRHTLLWVWPPKSLPVGLGVGSHPGGAHPFVGVTRTPPVFPASPPALAALVAVVFVAGAVNGVAGFGFAVVATMTLATVVDPAVAVVFVVVPILAVNLTLAGELSGEQVRTCGRRFRPLLAAAVLGAVPGMVVLDVLPEGPLRVVLGLVALAFVLSVQETVAVPGLARARAGCFVERPAAMAAVGGVGGALFGATNVGVQLVAYLRSCELRHDLFVGVVAVLFLSLNAVRVGAAVVLGLYPSLVVAGLSVAAAVPAVAGVVLGSRLRETIPARARGAAVLGLLTVVGLQLLRTGLGFA